MVSKSNYERVSTEPNSVVKNYVVIEMKPMGYSNETVAETSAPAKENGTEAEAKSKGEAEAGVGAVAQAEAKNDGKSEGEDEAEAGVGAVAQAEAKSDGKSEGEDEAEAGVEAVAQAEAKSDGKSEKVDKVNTAAGDGAQAKTDEKTEEEGKVNVTVGAGARAKTNEKSKKKLYQMFLENLMYCLSLAAATAFLIFLVMQEMRYAKNKTTNFIKETKNVLVDYMSSDLIVEEIFQIFEHVFLHYGLIFYTFLLIIALVWSYRRN